MRSDNARALLYFIRCGLSGLLIGAVPLFSASASTSEGVASIDAREQQRQQERERALQQQNAPQADARLSRPVAVLPDYPVNESPASPSTGLPWSGSRPLAFSGRWTPLRMPRPLPGQPGHCAHHQ